MFRYVLDPYLIVFATFFGGFMLPVQLILQIAHDDRGFGWREVVFGALASSLAMGTFTIFGSVAATGALQLAIGLVGTLLLTTLVAGIAGRTLGWALMRIVRLV